MQVETARHILTGSEVQLSTEQKCRLTRHLIQGYGNPSITKQI